MHLALAPDGRRHVEEVVAVPGRVESDVIETEPIFTRTEGELRGAGGQPPQPGAAVANADSLLIVALGDHGDAEELRSAVPPSSSS